MESHALDVTLMPTLPVVVSVLNAPVDGVVAPIAVEFRPVVVK